MIINEDTPSQEWPKTRILHIKGGIRVINDCNNVAQLSPYKDNNIIKVNIEKYNSLFMEISEMGLHILGVDLYSHPYEYNDIIPPQWKLNISHNNKPWFIWESIQKWAKLANAGLTNEDGLFLDISNRIRQQLKVCDWRMRDISESYHKILHSIVKSNDYKFDDRFQNQYTWLAYLSIQSFLIDACILRDYIAEFISIYIYNKKDLNVTTANSLLKNILRKTEQKDELTKYLQDSTAENGWIKILGTYRDVIIHKSPLVIADNQLFSICKKLTLKNIGDVPAIVCPIPSNIKDIQDRRSERCFKNYETRMKHTFLGRDDNDYIDGLDYCFETFKSLVLLLETVSTKSPYNPESITINSSEITIKKSSIN
jgi:hypothetical protein